VPAADSPDETVYLPGRNLLLLSPAALFCIPRGIPTVAIGSLRHNPFPDATPRFFRAFAAAASRAFRFRVTVIAPLRALTKTEVVRRGRSLPLHLSFCCLAPVGSRHCGRCNKCAERRRAFAAAGVADRTRYAAGNP
jgi:7-cyano-7-deazaguanine synthase